MVFNLFKKRNDLPKQLPKIEIEKDALNPLEVLQVGSELKRSGIELIEFCRKY